MDIFENRIKSFIENIPKDGDILICSHAGTIKMINSIFENEKYKNSLFKIEYLESIDYRYIINKTYNISII